jgi:hypothetical protein
MKNITKWMLAVALAIGGLGLTATPAKAAQIGFYIGSGDPGYYVPPSPGPGYVWINGYYADGYWVPGRWAFAGGYDGYYGNRFYGDRDDYYRRDYRDHDDFYRDRDRHDGDGGWNRDDHDRGRHEGWRGGRGHDR